VAAVKEDLFAILTPFGQGHLLRFWETLNPGQRESLAAEVRAIDFRLIAELVRQTDAKGAIRELASRAASPPSYRLGNPHNPIAPDAARQRGAEALRSGHVGAMLVAGGQGTRLGFEHPKGVFPIGPVSGKTLFQIHFEKVLATALRYGVRIPLYVMTSPETHDETVEFLAEQGRFGFPADDLHLFCQGTMPAVDAKTGKALLADRHHVALSPDGHGGMLAAFHRSGAMDDARRRGIRQLFHFQVDNPLAPVCDPEFMGYHLLSDSEFTTQVVRKHEPLEKVGNVVRADGRLHVIEYSDLPDDVAARRAADGSLEIWAGSIAVHGMEMSFLERTVQAAAGLPFHRANKKVPHLDERGNLVQPDQPNAVKFERFIFDLMPLAERAIIVEVDPARHFAPLKNAPGQPNDTPESVKAQLSALHRQWLRSAGFEVADDVPVEIGPRFALDAEELGSRMLSRKPVTEPTYFG
jgi:UDP-N-acetylglucosamine/UDP-N-acetylgalactosamine diphosphorylase